MTTTPRDLTVAEFAELVGKSESYVYDLIARGAIPVTRIPSLTGVRPRLYIKPADAAAFIARTQPAQP